MTITVGSKVRIIKGCRDREIAKGTTAKVEAIQELGAEYSYAVKVSLHFLTGFKAGKTFAFYARHINRLNDVTVRLNDGRPENTIEIDGRGFLPPGTTGAI